MVPVALAACSFDTAGIGRIWFDGHVADPGSPPEQALPSDFGATDGRGDGEPPDVASVDHTVSPDSTVDTVSPDSTVDTVSPDSTVDSLPPSCTERYGQAPGFMLCEETAHSCRFYCTGGGTSCNTICGMGQGVCISAHDNAQDSCTPKVPGSCYYPYQDAICTCAR